MVIMVIIVIGQGDEETKRRRAVSSGREPGTDSELDPSEFSNEAPAHVETFRARVAPGDVKTWLE